MSAIDSFYNDYNGKRGVSFDGNPGNAGQCVQPVAFYVRDYLHFPVYFADAVYWYTNFPSSPLAPNFTRIANDKNDPNQVPQRGDIIVWNGSLPNSGGAGHIAIVLDTFAGGFTSFDSNWAGKYCHAVRHDWTYVIGWLRPHGAAPAPSPSKAGYQRQVGFNGVNRRRAANTTADIIDEFPAGDTLDFKGFVHGENYAGNDIWFVGRYTGGYCWSGAFTDSGTHDLEDMTPVAPAPSTLQPWQRKVGGDPVNYRKTPNKSGVIIQTFPAGDTLDFQAFVKGESVEGNNIWFKGKYSGGYVWSGGMEGGSNTAGLAEFTDPVTANPTPTDPSPVVTSPATFVADSTLVKQVVPSPNFIEGQIAPTTVIVHQWDDPAKKPSRAGVISGFMKADSISPHYVIDDTGIYQLVKESNRAQHAGPNGNGVGIGIEFDPNMTEVGYQYGRKLIEDIRKRIKKDLTITGHNLYQATSCPKYIDLSRLEPKGNDPTTPTPTVPADSTPDSGTADLEKRVGALEKIVKAIVDFLTGLFKNFKT